MASLDVAGPAGNLLDCSICYGVLIEPVVGRCGHDFCQSCLARWCHEQRTRGVKVCCPLCRTALPDDAQSLAVCLRLKELTEQLLPEKVAERRQELSLAASRLLDRGRTEAQQRSRHGRTRFLRARRTLPHHQPGGGMHQSLAGDPQTHWTPSLLRTATAAAFAALSGLPPNASDQAAAWVAPQVNFTMGWWEPSDRRRKGMRHRPPRAERSQATGGIVQVA